MPNGTILWNIRKPADRNTDNCSWWDRIAECLVENYNSLDIIWTRDNKDTQYVFTIHLPILSVTKAIAGLQIRALLKLLGCLYNNWFDCMNFHYLIRHEILHKNVGLTFVVILSWKISFLGVRRGHFGGLVEVLGSWNHHHRNRHEILHKNDGLIFVLVQSWKIPFLGAPRGHFGGFSWGFGKLKPSPSDFLWNSTQECRPNFCSSPKLKNSTFWVHQGQLRPIWRSIIGFRALKPSPSESPWNSGQYSWFNFCFSSKLKNSV